MVAEAEHELMTIREAADFLRVSEVTISRWIKQGRLHAYRVGPRALRIRRNELDGLILPVAESNGQGFAPVRPVDEALIRRITDDAIAKRLAIVEELLSIRDHFSAQRGGIPLSSSTDIIIDERRKRSEQLAG